MEHASFWRAFCYEATTLKDLIKDWNETLPQRLSMVKEHNASIEEKYRSGKISAEAAQKLLHDLPTLVKDPSNSWIRWWRQVFGWSLLTRASDDQQFLPFTHVDMQLSRQRTLDLVANGVHPFLILNYDQLWRSAWQMSAYKIHYKDRSKVGNRAHRAKVGQRPDKKVHAVRGARRSRTVSWLYMLQVSDALNMAHGHLTYLIPKGPSMRVNFHWLLQMTKKVPVPIETYYLTWTTPKPIGSTCCIVVLGIVDFLHHVSGIPC